jgi:membrane protease YdiL (CAAX protease family)
MWVAQIVIALLFALYHVAGGQSVASSFIGPGIWSFVFGTAALLSKGIAMPTGIHFAANLLQAAFGMKEFPSIWTIDLANNITQQSQQRIEWVGNSIQIVLLVAVLVVMYFTQRRAPSP